MISLLLAPDLVLAELKPVDVIMNVDLFSLYFY